MTALRLCLTAALPVVLPAAAAVAQTPATASPQACVAVMLPSVQGIEGSALDVATAVRDLFISYLTGPSVRSLPLEARLPAQAALEAGQKGCRHVVLPSVSRKRGGGGKFGRAMGQAIGSAAWHLPYGGSAASAAGRAAVFAGAQTVSNLALETRRKDEITLAYRVGTPESVVDARPVTTKAKAKVDGEDLLTPLIEQASQRVLTMTEP